MHLSGNCKLKIIIFIFIVFLHPYNIYALEKTNEKQYISELENIKVLIVKDKINKILKSLKSLKKIILKTLLKKLHGISFIKKN
jgi:hypothetical protein